MIHGAWICCPLTTRATAPPSAEQEGPHGEWMEMNKSTIAIDQEGNYDITFQTKMFEKEFTKFILEETKESISKF